MLTPCPPCRFCGSDEALDTLDGDLKWVHFACYDAAALTELPEDFDFAYVEGLDDGTH